LTDPIPGDDGNAFSRRFLLVHGKKLTQGGLNK
jgi:hypothetical protein